MTAIQKKALYNKWNTSAQSTKIRLVYEYLQILRAGEKDMTWLSFLKNSLPLT